MFKQISEYFEPSCRNFNVVLEQGIALSIAY